MVTSYIGIGSNLGNRELHIKKAIEFLQNIDGVTVEKISSIYETKPVGGPVGQSNFLNGVIKIRTSLEPSVLLKDLRSIEDSLMRKRAVKNGSRTMDLDILTYGKRVMKEPDLLIPHPKLEERDFVLKGFFEVAPEFIHPLLGKSIRDIYKGSGTKSVKTIKSIPEMISYSRVRHKSGKRIGFVPTMGYLHEGHLSLMRKARKEADVVVISIFVNPAQFSPQEDFKKYPRNFREDERLAKSCGVDAIFYPEAKDIYPDDYHTYVNVEELTKALCGASRPGHFRGVTTVVAKLFNIIQPDAAYFGQKDAQQAIVIKQMVKDLDMPVKIKVLPVIREKDGLAMSSRNAYLKAQERKDALILYQSLLKARGLIKKGEKRANKIKAAMKKMISEKKTAKIDYISVVNAENLKDAKSTGPGTLIAVAVKIGSTRLIDNIEV